MPLFPEVFLDNRGYNVLAVVTAQKPHQTGVDAKGLGLNPGLSCVMTGDLKDATPVPLRREGWPGHRPASPLGDRQIACFFVGFAIGSAVFALGKPLQKCMPPSVFFCSLLLSFFLESKKALFLESASKWIEAFTSEVVVERSDDEVLDGPLLIKSDLL